MAKFAVEITVGLNQSALTQAERGYKRLGDSAEQALKRTDALSRGADAGSTKMREAALKAAASFDRFAKSVDDGGRGSERALVRLNVRIEELRQSIQEAQRAGAPVDADAVRTLQALEQQTDENVRALGRMKAAQDDVADAVRASKGDFDGQGRQINDLRDIFDAAGGSVGAFGLKVMAAAGAMRAGYEIGTKLRDTVNSIGEEIFGVTGLMDRMVRQTREFHTVARLINSVWGPATTDLDAYTAAQRRFLAVQRDAQGRGLRGDVFAEDEREYIEWYLEQQQEKARAAEEAGQRAMAAADREAEALARVNAQLDRQLQTMTRMQFVKPGDKGATAPRIPVYVHGGQVFSGVNDASRAANDLAKDFSKVTESLDKTGSRADDFWKQQQAGWADLFGFLADEFGGVFNYLQRAMQAVQNAQGLSSNVSQLGSSMGMGASSASALGAVAGTAYLFYVAYKEISAHIKRQKAKSYGNEAEYSRVGGEEGTTRLDQNAFEVVKAIRSVISEFEDALRISITDLDKIGIRIRNDGKYVAAYVQGEMIGHFANVDEAIRAALMQTIQGGGAKFAGLPDLIAQGIKDFSVPDADEFMEFLGALREIADISLSDSAIQFQRFAMHMNDLYDALEKLNVSPAVIQGLKDLGAAEVAALQAWSDSITGRQKTRAELMAEKQRDATLFNAEKAMRVAEYKLRYADLQAQMTYLNGRRGMLQADATLRQQELELYQAYLEAMGQVIAALAAIPDIKIGDIRIDIPGGGGGSGGKGERKGLREEIESWGLGDVAAALRETSLWFVEMRDRIKDAGFGAEETARLMGLLREEEERRVEAIKRDVTRRVQDFVRQGTPAGGALMGGLRGVDEQFTEMRDSLRELREAGELTWREFRELRDSLLAAAAAARERMIGEAGTQMLLDLYSLLGEEEKVAQLKFQLTVAEFEIRKAELELAMRTYNMLDQGLLDELGALIQRVRDAGPALFGGGTGGGTGGTAPSGSGKYVGDRHISGGFWWTWDGTKWVKGEAYVRPGTGGSGGSTPSADDSDMRRALDMMRDWMQQGVHPLTAELQQLAEDFSFLQRVLGDTAEVHEAHARKLKSILDRYLDPIRDYRRGMDFSDGSTLRGDQQFFAARDQFRSVLGALMGGDLTQLDRVVEAADLYRTLGRSFTGGEGYRFIDSEIKAALDRVLQIAPGFAAGAPLGATANPMTMTAPALQQSLETGNTMLLAEARLQTFELRRIAGSNDQIAASLANTLSVRDVA